MSESSAQRASENATIRIAAAVIINEEGRTLLVRKRGTKIFIQPGGKIEKGESPQETLARELDEELGLALIKVAFLGELSAVAANETNRRVNAAVFRVDVSGKLKLGAEIEEALWINPAHPPDREIATLTKDQILPLVVQMVRGRRPDGEL